MRRCRTGPAWRRGALLGLPLLLVAAVPVADDAQPKPGLIERTIEKLTGGNVVVRGLGGSPTALRAKLVELRDKQGAWLVIDDLTLDWSPLRLLTGRLAIDRLASSEIELKRPRVSSSASSSFSLPLKISVQALDVARLQVDTPVAGSEAAFSLAGNLNLESLDQGSLKLDAKALDSTGSYHIEGSFSPETVDGRLRIEEPPDGPLARFAGLPDLGKLALVASAQGPRSAIATNLSLDAGPMQAQAQGTLDLAGHAADVTITASAPAMNPRANLSWQSIALQAKLNGPFKRPSVEGRLQITALEVGGTEVQTLSAQVQGDQGKVELQATLDAVRIPGRRPDLLAAAPVLIQATASLDQPDRPVTFRLEHPLIAADGKVLTAGERQATIDLSLPRLAPLAAAVGADVEGHSEWTVHAAEKAGATTLTADGTLGVTGGSPPLPGLLGESASIAVAASLQGRDITRSSLSVHGKAIQLSADGGLVSQFLKVDWKLDLPRLQVLDSELAGSMKTTGRVSGPVDDFGIEAQLTGNLGVRNLPPAPINAHVQLAGLPKTPSGRITANGMLGGSPLELAVLARRSTDATVIDIQRADWKSAHGAGRLTLASGTRFPVGNLELRMTRLQDLQPFVGEPLTGGFTAKLSTTEVDGEQRARLSADGRVAGLPGNAAVDRLSLQATVVNPMRTPVLDASLTAEGFSAPGVAGSGRVSVKGPQNALALELTADARELGGAPARLSGSAVIDATARTAALSALQASWKGEDLRLLSPARIAFAKGLSVDQLRVGLQRAVLEASGRITPTLDLTAQVRNLSPEVAAAFVPGLQAAGSIRGDARLGGSLARPTGTIRLEGRGLRVIGGPASALPPADMTATADLSGETARIDGRLTVGPKTSLRLRGLAALSRTGRMDLQATGSADLSLANPILTATGRSVRGQLKLQAGLTGTLSNPRLSGSARLAGGEIQDFVQGAHLKEVEALLQLEGDSIRIARLTSRAGPGTLSAVGTIGVLKPGMPIDVTITARDARPLSGDLLSVNLNADLTARGQLLRQFQLAGDVRINKAEIRIPETLPTSVATLDVRRPGQKPTPPVAPGPVIALDLTIRAPRQIYVRGRGLDAELGGRVRVQGTAKNPQPLGSFELRRGQFTLANQTLRFSEGKVSFNGDSLTDPSIDFTISSTNGSITARLNIGGTVKQPRITMTSTPELPQDEILAQLLFGRSVSSLSPFEVAQIASALGELTGVTSGTLNPLSKVREVLGLSQLSVGTTATGKPALEAGRYLAPNVYVGVEQGAAAGSTSAKVEVDLSKHLKLKGTVGTGYGSASGSSGQAGSSVGVIYQFEY